ncbi:MAG: hypothetical protein DRQ59_11985 [Gammaproteobacteria bacterium]|nr:MAG: hypothetical protein DRQ59_11985 [Gammaproteobacteria bacterium]
MNQNSQTSHNACRRTQRSWAAVASVEAVEKPVDNFGTVNIEAESRLILFWQRLMTLIFMCRRLFLFIFCTIKSLFVFLQLRYVASIQKSSIN